HINRAYASLFSYFIASTNRVGYEDGINYYGGATIHDPNGAKLAHGPYHEEALVYAEIDLNQLHRTRSLLPLLRDERPELVQKELERILNGK
ncbi:MAG: nitrilase-related carbon-nitrogen hydrolase, partial [Chloroflexota bacterium]